MHRVVGLITSQLYSGARESFALLIVVATANTAPGVAGSMSASLYQLA